MLIIISNIAADIIVDTTNLFIFRCIIQVQFIQNTLDLITQLLLLFFCGIILQRICNFCIILLSNLENSRTIRNTGAALPSEIVALNRVSCMGPGLIQQQLTPVLLRVIDRQGHFDRRFSFRHFLTQLCHCFFLGSTIILCRPLLRHISIHLYTRSSFSIPSIRNRSCMLTNKLYFSTFCRVPQQQSTQHSRCQKQR